MVQHNKQDLPVQEVLSVPLEDRADWLLRQPKPGDIVNTLSAEDFYITALASTEPQQNLALLNLARPDQVDLLLDLELWRAGSLDEDKVRYWLLLISAMSYDQLAQFLRSGNLDILALAFKTKVNVFFAISDQEHFQQQLKKQWQTIDGVYYFDVPDRQLLPAFLRVIQVLKAEHPDAYIPFLMVLFGGVEGDLYLRELHWRDARLSAQGFLPYAEAASVYQGLTAAELTRLPTRGQSANGNRGAGNRLQAAQGLFPAVPKQAKTCYFDTLYAQLEDPSLIEAMGVELMALVNNVALVNSRENITLATLQDAMLQVRGYLSIALERLSPDNSSDAMHVLRNVYVKHLFQRAVGELEPLRKQAFAVKRQPIYAVFPDAAFSAFFPQAARMIGAVSAHPPCFYHPPAAADVPRHFYSLRDIANARDCLQGIGYIARVVQELFAVQPENLLQFHRQTDASMQQTFLTLLCRGMMQCRELLAPFTKQQGERLITALRRNADVYHLLCDKLWQRTVKIWPQTENNQYLRQWLRRSIQDLYSEISGLRETPRDLNQAVSTLVFARP